MFKYVSYMGDGRYLSVGIVPAPVSEELRGHPLAELSESHFLFDDAEATARWVAAIEIADKREIEAARMQFAFMAKNLESEMFDRWFNFSYAGEDQGRRLIREEVDGEDGVEVAQRLFDACLADARKLLSRCASRPKSERTALELRGAVEFLAEGREFFHNLRRSDEDAARAKRNEEAYVAFRAQVIDFVEGLGSNYAGTAATLSGIDGMEKAVAACLREAGSPRSERLARREVLELMAMAGDYDTLWVASASIKNRDEMVATGMYSLLDDKDLAALRAKALEVIRAQSFNFAGGGFVGTLRAVAAAAHHRADHMVENGVERLEAKARSSKRDRDDTDESYRKRVREAVEKAPAERRGYDLQAARNRRVAVTVDDLLDTVDRVLRPGVDRRPLLRFSRSATGWVGELEGSDDVLVVYDDSGCGGYDAAVFAVRMDREALGNLPTLEEVKQGAWADVRRHLGTNYRSLQDLFGEIERDRDSGFFFSAPVRVSFEEAPEAEPSPAPGM